MPAFLTILSGLPTQVFTLEPGTAVAGRAPDADIELGHVEISRHHCRFTWDGTQCSVEDMGSIRGTRVNGERIAVATALEPGNEIGIGPAILKLAIGNLPAAEPEPAPVEEAAEAEMLVRGVKTDIIEVDAELTLGRDPDSDVWLNDPAVSRQHASVKPGPHGGCIVADLNSSGGSFVNGHRFDTHELTVGDRLQVGPFTFQFDGHALRRVSKTAGGRIDAAGVFAKSETGGVILDDVTLHIAPSRFVGILGPSGAGKSSLLHTLSGMRAPDGGIVLIDGDDVYGVEHPRSFGFVPQEDIVHPELRVADALRFAARLRLPADTPHLELQKLILQTMDQLGLRDHAAKPIARLSGGQRKRVSVGAELLAKPAILFLDEPSSGLDPATEFQLMELLRDLADTGCTIVCTTHVMENAYLMDQLVVLTGGCLAFQGSAQEAREYFGVPKLTALYDRMLEKPAQEWRDEFSARAGEGGQTSVPAAGKGGATVPRRPFALPILLQRQWAILRADWRNVLLLLGQPLVIAALVAWVVSGNPSLVLFFAYIATLWFGCSNAAQEIVKEIAIYKRERLVGVGAHSYLAGKFLFLTALTSLQGVLLFCAVILFEGGLGGREGWQVLGLLGTALASVGLGCAISAWARSVMQAVMIVPLMLIPMILFSGYTVEVQKMSPSVRMVSAFTPTFAAQSLMDLSFFWRVENIGSAGSGVTSETHLLSITNFRERGYLFDSRTPGSKKQQGPFRDSTPGLLGLLTHFLWGAAGYAFAWQALKARERK